MRVLCDEVGMARQNFYKSRKHCEKLEIETEVIRQAVLKERREQPRIGVRKLHRELGKQGIEIGRDRLFEVLRELQLLVPPARRRARTTDSRHTLPVFHNLVKDLEVTKVNQVWVSDLTYLRIDGGFVYLSLIMDLFSRKIVGWHCGDSLEAVGCMNALRMAFKQLPSGTPVIHHSDRGCQYCCHAYVTLLKSRDLQISMTEENHCYENAHAERLNGILKQEYWLDRTFRNRLQANAATAQAVQLYNTRRLHTSLAYRTPEEFYQLHLIPQATEITGATATPGGGRSRGRGSAPQRVPNPRSARLGAPPASPKTAAAKGGNSVAIDKTK